MRESVSYAPLPLVVAVEGVVAIAVVALGLTSGDRLGLLLGLVAGTLVAAVALRDAVVRPVLRADLDGVTVAPGVRRRHIPWTAVTAVQASVETRRGIRSPVLEIDLEHSLVLLSRRQLGADPVEVAGTLTALRDGRPVRPETPPSDPPS